MKEIMKTLKYFLLIILPLFAFVSCENDDGENPGFADDEVPRIYMDWQTHLTRKVGETISFTPDISPSDGASYRWTLDGEVISTEKDLEYKLDRLIMSELKFEVVRKNASNSRMTNLVVTNEFVPKTYNKKSIGFLTKNGTLSDIDWANITHLVVSGAFMNKDEKEGTVYLDDSYLNKMNMSTIVALAHHYGVYVMMEVSGVINYLNAAPEYGNYNFYDYAVGPNSEALATSIVALAKNLDVDGINIYMDKANTANGEFADPGKLRDFYASVANQMKADKNTIDGEDYDYLMSLSVVAGWTRGSIRDAAKLETYDWVNVLAFAIEDLDAVPHSSQWAAENEINSWLTGWIGPISADRLVLGVPTFGVHFTGIPNDYGWDNWGTFNTYVPYKTIVAQYSDAPTKNGIIIKDNGDDKSKPVEKIYYDGLPAIRDKAAFVTSQKLAGMALWSLENDTKDGSSSLIKQMNTSLGNQ